MGYSHYLWRPPELDRDRWREWMGDVQQILSNLPAQVPQIYYPIDGQPITVKAPLIVTGPIGNEGWPDLSDDKVAFNGGGWADVEGRPQRLWCESFWVERVLDTSHWAFDLSGDPFDDRDLGAPPEPDERGWYCESYKTRQQPYDLAVSASLIRLAHRFPEGIEVGSDGGLEEWQAGMDLCREVFGHAEWPFAAGVAAVPVAEADRLNELLAKRGGGTLEPHEVGELRDLLDRDLAADRTPGVVEELSRRADGPACGREELQ